MTKSCRKLARVTSVLKATT